MVKKVNFYEFAEFEVYRNKRVGNRKTNFNFSLNNFVKTKKREMQITNTY